ncbi:hypothetical protein DYL59_05665 [Pseudomonas kairouanensis]|uniref:Uncharacterized protein n=1 Tax=Pseudomonas kairouanensis TaxID=2293832 RepID=A0A4Z0AYA0_9PSED|nr:hypothetical protein [Pseudomonas kairouanensis]TFY91440.1 hypothetical protein DYL59_05665 [Pseudomonas kairouanensis]
MEGTLALALSPEDYSPETLVLDGPSYSASDLSEREDLRRMGDRELIVQLLPILQTPAALQASTPVVVSELSLLGQWGDMFTKAINSAPFLEWADKRQLDFTTLHVHNGQLRGRAYHQSTELRFTLADTSGWWRVANPIIYIAQLMDPAELGMPYLGDRATNTERMLTLDRVLAFYGYPMPTNRFQAQVIIEELRAADAFPSIDNVGQNRSLIHGERHSQQRDFQQLANTLETLVPFDGLDLFSTRLHLASGSLLARTLIEAAQSLKGVVEDGVEGVQPNLADYFFDHAKQVVRVMPNRRRGEIQVRDLRPKNPNLRWHTLRRLADKLGTDIYPDHSLSIAACLQVYGIERITTQTELAPLIARLRQWTLPPAPTLHASARSLDERYIYSRFIGVLNDRHTLRDALLRTATSGVLSGPQGLDGFITADPEILPVKLLPGRQKLQALVQQTEFVAILVQQRIDPSSHVLLSVENGIGARDQEGVWKPLTQSVLANPKLASMARQLLATASELGGEIRTNDAISLRQALRLYGIPLPTTLDGARRIAQRWTITVPHPMYESNYWRAVIPAKATQPIGWTLSKQERQQVLATSALFVAGTEQTLFNYLSEPVLQGKTPEDIRAEADLLMSRLITSPRAQQLASQLAQAVQWHGSEASVSGGHASRSALVWAALILNFEPDVDTHIGHLNGLDLTAPHFWAESSTFVRSQIEHSFRGLDPGAAALATHLMLCGQGPQLLVRDIPDSLPYLSTQTWVLFQQYATYLELRVPGAARQMSHDEILYLAYLPLRGSWRLFLDSPEAIPPILAWAAVNGVLPRQKGYTPTQTNTAITALNALRTRQRAAQATFALRAPNQRSIALLALKKVYPHSAALEDLVWSLAVQDTNTANKYSFIDLYMANELDATSVRWVSSDPAINYADMARHFAQLQPFNQAFYNAFDLQLKQLQGAYIEYMQNALSGLSLPRREALEYGTVELFSLRSGPGRVGEFGLIVCARFYTDQHVYECFPKYLLFRPRRDLNYATLLAAATSPSQTVPNLALDWLAYAQGTEPVKHTALPPRPGLYIRKLDNPLPEVQALPQADADGHRIPRSFDSPRSLALATQIIQDHYLQGGAQLRALAAVVPTLETVSRGDDPWSDYFQNMTLAVK